MNNWNFLWNYKHKDTFLTVVLMHVQKNCISLYNVDDNEFLVTCQLTTILPESSTILSHVKEFLSLYFITFIFKSQN